MPFTFYCLVLGEEVGEVCDRQCSPCPQACLRRGAERERKNERTVFINDLIFTDLDASHGICGTTSTKSTHLTGLQLAQGSKISCSGECWTMDVFLPELLRITPLCRSCVTHPAGLTAQSCQCPGSSSIWTPRLWTKVGQVPLPECWQEQAGAVKMCGHSGQDEEDQGWGKPIKTKQLEVK